MGKKSSARKNRSDSGDGVSLPAIPSAERWLFKNPEALASVRQGLAESAAGKTRHLASFAVVRGPRTTRS